MIIKHASCCLDLVIISLCQQMAQLNMSLQTVTEQKRLLEDELQQHMNTVRKVME